MNESSSLHSNNLDNAIVKTVAYFSLFKYPLTLIELAEYLNGSQASLTQIKAQIENSEWLKERIEELQGFYFLKGKREYVELRLSRYVIGDQKIKKVHRALRVIASVPSVRGIMLCNNIGQLNSSLESDIDVLLVVKNGQLWITRLVLLFVTELMGVRIHGEDAKDKLCLSFIVSDAHLDLHSIALPEGDVYLKYWFETLLPVYDTGVYAELVKSNPTLRGHARTSRDRLTSRYQIRPISFLRGLFRCILWVLTPFKPMIERFEWNHLSPQKRSLATSRGTEVVLNESMLKFHDNDRRWLYLQRWRSLTASQCSPKK